jgi:hypothetical protein
MTTLADVARRARQRAALEPGGARDQALAAHPPPAELAYLTRHIGAAAVLRLIEEAGGTRIDVPKCEPEAVNQGHKLARMIGLPAARALVAGLGAGQIKVPLCRWWRARIYRAEGDSYAEIARRLGVTESAVHGYLRAARMTNQPEQLTLL